jgi:hypothetical protein
VARPVSISHHRPIAETVSTDPDFDGAEGADLDGPTWTELTVALRERYLEPPSRDTERRHLAAMAAVLNRRRRRRRAVVAAAGAASMLGGATLAAAGELPDPVQTRVAEIVGHVNISLPGAPTTIGTGVTPTTQQPSSSGRPSAPDGSSTTSMTTVRPGRAGDPPGPPTPDRRGGPDDRGQPDAPGNEGRPPESRPNPANPGPPVTTPPHPTNRGNRPTSTVKPS